MTAALPMPAAGGEPDQPARNARGSLEILTRQALAPALSIDDSRTVVSINDRLCDLLGVDPADVLGQPCSSVCLGPHSGDDQQALDCPEVAFRRRGHGPSTWPVSLRRSDGSALPVRLTAVGCDGGLLVIVAAEAAGEHDMRPADGDEVGAVRVTCLGEFSATLADGAPVAPRRPHAFALLKYLLVSRPRAAEEAKIVSALWPRTRPDKGLRSLRVLVHDLRRALEPGLTDGRASRLIRRPSASYIIPADAPIATDVAAFVRCARDSAESMRSGRRDEALRDVERALALYGGDLFGTDVAAGWFAGERRRLRSTWLDMLVLHGVLLTETGDRREAANELRRAVEADVLREDAHRLLLALLAQEVGRDAALRHFVDMSDEIKARFGVPPSRETARLVRRVAGGDDLRDLMRDALPARPLSPGPQIDEKARPHSSMNAA